MPPLSRDQQGGGMGSFNPERVKEAGNVLPRMAECRDGRAEERMSGARGLVDWLP